MTATAVVDGTDNALSALPVTIDVDAAHAPHVREYVEQVLGWQPVDAESSQFMPPAIRIVDVATLLAGSSATAQPAVRAAPSHHERRSAGTVPCLLLVTAESSPVHAAEVAANHAPQAVIAWPDEREQLRIHAGRVLRSRPGSDGATAEFTIGGCAGGVGTTTVTLALAAIMAWRGRRSLAVVRGPVPTRSVTPADQTLLRAPDLFARASAVDGVPRCRIVRVDDAASVSIADESIDCVISDGGVDVDVDVVVARPDGAAIERVGSTTAGWAIIVGTGPVGLRTVAHQLPGRQIVQLDTSARVARAAAARRLPGAFPGAWLKPLVPLARQMEPSHD